MITLDQHIAIRLTRQVKGLGKKSAVVFVSPSTLTHALVEGNYVLATEAEVIKEFSTYASGVPAYTNEGA